MAASKHIVAQGECLASIGASYGFDWQTLWNHPTNASLKNSRKDPNILYPGDEVFVPEKTPREENGVTDAHHKFKLKGVPETLRIRLLDELDHPCNDMNYEFVTGSLTITGTTDSDGELQVEVPPLEKNASLFVGEERREIKLKIGGLDPLDKVSGVQARLRNLGFDPGPIDGIMGPRTREAISDLQEQLGLEPTGELNAPTLSKLKERHGR